ncbi:MAG: energy-coupling factor transporter transmembrane protein EcfT [Clostridia bacterium]|nr:energy-coupling factor transporter transmembrane protein EcfT [Clostridia bacterium]
MKQNEFKTFHPIVNFIYFLFVICFSVTFMHPVCLGFSLIGSMLYTYFLGSGKKLLFVLPVFLATALINPAFNHAGITVLGYLPSGNPLTLESIIYGLATGIMIASVILWFSCYTEIMTSDKFIYLFGRILPSLSLLLSMTLRFVPRFISQIRMISAAQKGIGRGSKNGGIFARAKNGLSVLSAATTWALENSIETADSMKGRGYGLRGRTAFSIYKFDKRDTKALAVILLLGLYVLAGRIAGFMSFRYIPSLYGAGFSYLNLSFFAAYFLLCIYPLGVEILEAQRWKRTA